MFSGTLGHPSRLKPLHLADVPENILAHRRHSFVHTFLQPTDDGFTHHVITTVIVFHESLGNSQKTVFVARQSIDQELGSHHGFLVIVSCFRSIVVNLVVFRL